MTMRQQLRFGASGLCAVGLVAIAGRAMGDDATWVSALSGDWTDATNWSTDPVFPDNNGTTFDVFITPTGAAYTVTLDAAITIDEFNMPSADATLDLTSNNLVTEFDWNQSASRVLGTGEITVRGTASFTGGAVLEGVDIFTIDGSLDLSGGGIVLEIDDTCVDNNGLTATWSGSGTIRMLDGSDFNNRSQSTLSISGSGAFEWDDVGTTPVFNNFGTILKTTDAGVTFFDGLAFDNQGTLRVESGTFRADNAIIGGGTLDRGTWEVFGGSTIDLVGVDITNIDARVVLDGPGSDIFDSGSGLSALRNLDTVGPAGRFDIVNGRDFSTVGGLTEFGDITVGSVSTGGLPSTLSVGGTFDQMGGTLTLDGGTLVSGVNLLNGSLGGNGTVFGPTSANGNVSPGLSPGLIRFMDGLQIEDDNIGQDTIFFFELGGLVPVVEHDQIRVNGLLQFLDGDNLAGTLDVQLINAFFPNFGDEFLIIRYEQVLGQFEFLVGLDLGGGLQLIPEYRNDGLYLVTVPAPASMLAFVGVVCLARRRR